MSDDPMGAVHRNPADPDYPDDPTVWDPEVEELEEAECLRLIPADGIGRLAYSARTGAVVIPVGYKVDDGSIVFRTVLDSPTDEDLRTGIRGADYKVSFEVDHMDEDARAGWFVLIQGPARHVDADDDRISVWEPGARSSGRLAREHFMIITPKFVRGRRLRRARGLARQRDPQFSVCMPASRGFAAAARGACSHWMDRAQGGEERVSLALWPDDGACWCRSSAWRGPVERTHPWGLPAPLRESVPALAAYDAGVAAICQLASQFDDFSWGAQTPCPEWRAFELAGHLRCIADDFHEYLDEAPVSRYARLMATGAYPDTLSRKLARQNAAELAALADAPPAEHIAAFALSARKYAARLSAVWDLPHHQYRDTVVTVGGMAGAASAEWHLHAWDLARALGTDYQPADPAAVLAGWRAGMPHLPLAAGSLGARVVRHHDPWHAVLAASGRLAAGHAVAVAPRSAWAAWPARLRRRRRD